MESSANFNFNFNEAISLVVTCESQDEIDFYWEQLTSNGGKEGRCGWLKDKYGVSWQIVPSILGKLMNNAAHAPKVMEAFMQMNKFDIATLENAAG
jgi:predicted 3-demethylubiquinone-9 3-methyltransferase (glyoxalase superfamily)